MPSPRSKVRNVLLLLQQGKCFCCGKRMRIGSSLNSPDCATIEHIQPKAFGGANSTYNYVVTCGDCNCRMVLYDNLKKHKELRRLTKEFIIKRELVRGTDRREVVMNLPPLLVAGDGYLTYLTELEEELQREREEQPNNPSYKSNREKWNEDGTPVENYKKDLTN